jgi:hypothetical protein
MVQCICPASRRFRVLVYLLRCITEVIAFRQRRAKPEASAHKPWEIWEFYKLPITGKAEVARAGVEVERMIVQVLIAIAGISATFLSKGVLGEWLDINEHCMSTYIYFSASRKYSRRKRCRR